MSSPSDYADILKLYEETFGEPPIITGGSLWSKTSIIERLLDAIDSGKPFLDVPIPAGTLV